MSGREKKQRADVHGYLQRRSRSFLMAFPDTCALCSKIGTLQAKASFVRAHCYIAAMKILISTTMDHAPGIHGAFRGGAGFGEVHIVAPASEQSAVGHAITI